MQNSAASLLLGAIITLSPCCIASASDEDKNGWRFELTPYLWLPTISGDLNFSPPPGGVGAPSIEVGPTDWLELLNGAALLNGSMRKGRFSLNADVVYLGLKSDKDKVVAAGAGDRIPVDGSLNLATETRFDGSSVTLVAGYQVSQTDRSAIELIGGVRYLALDIRTSWNLSVDISGPEGVILPAEGERENKVDLWDGVIGLRGYWRLGSGRWSVPYYFDVGTGSSELTWQALAGFSYRYDWGELMMMYRHLDYSEGSGRFLQGLALSGPTIGARFRF